MPFIIVQQELALFVRNPSSSSEYAAGYQNILFWLLAVLLLFAPLYRGGNRPLPLLALELGSVLLLVPVFWNLPRNTLSRHEVIALGLLVVFPLVYLIPLPGYWIQVLPGRDMYSTGMSLLDIDLSDFPATLTLVPQATASAWLSLLIPVAVFLGARALPASYLLKLVTILLGMAALQAALGLMQFGQGADSPLYWGMTHTHFDSGVGTYPNRNHLAGLLEMVLPIALALLVYSIGRKGRNQSSGHWRNRIVFFSTLRGHVAFGYAMLSLVLLVGLVFTRSRTGISLTILGVILVTVILSRRLGGDNVYGATGTTIALATGIAMAIGLVPVLDRFSALDPLQDMRWVILQGLRTGLGPFSPG
ncbi:MAG: hypothetical protein HC808_16385 [Candidatus Competibacteraceae bacterium]|nr:hypothetical protein [Candidatus Competibacteraceae bacterium]